MKLKTKGDVGGEVKGRQGEERLREKKARRKREEEERWKILGEKWEKKFIGEERERGRLRERKRERNVC